MKQKSVLFVVPNLTTGGIQTQTLLLAKYFQNELGLKVTFWGVFSKQDNYTNLLEAENIHYELHPEIDFLISEKYLALPKSKKIRLWLDLRKHIKKGKFKLILPYTEKIGRIFNFIWRFTTAKACFSFERGGHPNPVKRPYEIYDYLSKSSQPIYVANSQHGKDAMAIIKDIHPNKIAVIRNEFLPKPDNNINEDWEQNEFLATDTIIVTMIANYFEQKDHETVIRAWAKIARRYNAKLLFAGLGGADICKENFDKTNALVQELGLQDSIILLGSVKNTSRLLRHSDIGLLSTVSEGCPNSVLEYMGAGLPVIGTDVPGIREIIPSNNLPFLFPFGDIDQCAIVLEKLISNNDLRKNIGLNNQTHVNSTFSSGKMYDAYYEILKKKKII